METMANNPDNHSLSPLQYIAVASLCIAILSFLSPQIGMLGRGLRTTLPALAVSGFAIFVISPMAFIRAFERFWVSFLCGFIFLLQAALRFVHADNASNLWYAWFVGPFIALVFLLWIAALAELGYSSIRRLRFWLLYGWCISLAVGLPILIQHPGIARSTMGNINAFKNAVIWALYGVGEYNVYTSLSICFGPLFFVSQKLKPLWRWPAIILISLSSAAVLVSTFTMASVALMLSFFGTLLVWTKAGHGFLRIIRLVLVLLPFVFLPLLYTQAKNFSQTEFVVSKVERLYQGISKKGLAKGDETNRAKMFMNEMRTIANEPFLGYIPGVCGQRGHGHSSFANLLVLFGFFGAALWVVALLNVFRDFLKNKRDFTDRYALWISLLIFILCGILNPIWHAPAALGALFALTLPARKNQMEPKLQSGEE